MVDWKYKLMDLILVYMHNFLGLFVWGQVNCIVKEYNLQFYNEVKKVRLEINLFVHLRFQNTF